MSYFDHILSDSNHYVNDENVDDFWYIFFKKGIEFRKGRHQIM